MDETVLEKQQIIEDKLDNLRKHVRFVLCSYDYHHKNNEFEILKEKIDILEKAAETYNSFCTEQRKFVNSIENAKQKSYLIDAVLAQICPTKQSEPELDSSHSMNKENM